MALLHLRLRHLRGLQRRRLLRGELRGPPQPHGDGRLRVPLPPEPRDVRAVAAAPLQRDVALGRAPRGRLLLGRPVLRGRRRPRLPLQHGRPRRLPGLPAPLPRRRRQAAHGRPRDFVATVAFSFLWLVSTSAWAKALTDVKTSTGAPLPDCHPPAVACYPAGVTPMGSLNISVAFGFLNLVLWVGSSWFVYKETNLHRPAAAPAPPGAM